MNCRAWFGNCATSLDHKLGKEEKQTYLSNTRDFRIVHHIRSEIGAIGVGSSTAIIDNPSLTVKREYIDKEGITSPVPIIFDRRGRVSPESKIFTVDPNRKVIWVVDTKVGNPPRNAILINSNQGDPLKRRVEQVLDDLDVKGDIMIEGGVKLMYNFIEAKMISKLRVFTSARSLNNSNLILNFPSTINFKLLSTRQLGNGTERIFVIS